MLAVHTVESTVAKLQASLESEGATLEKGVRTMERFNESSKPIKIWLDESELSLSMASTKPSTFNQAEEQLIQAQVFIM